MYLSDQASYAFFTARATLRKSFSSVSLQEQEQDLNRDARLCIAPQPPLAPSRGRSRSRSAERFQTRVAAIIAAHRINLAQRRGGQKGQAQRRTRAIHKHFLQILNEYVDRASLGAHRRQRYVFESVRPKKSSEEFSSKQVRGLARTT